ncbi:MAG: hypothetical protein O2967_17920 [Proteobacteria bacterium]|nr:hypothetical protein [Pseudomonadota bacterium]
MPLFAKHRIALIFLAGIESSMPPTMPYADGARDKALGTPRQALPGPAVDLSFEFIGGTGKIVRNSDVRGRLSDGSSGDIHGARIAG